MKMDSDALHEHADGLWTLSTAHSFLGLHVGARMTVVRLSSGGLWVHSPVALSTAQRHDLDALGPVAHIVCPNAYHHVYAAALAEAYPAATVHGPAALRRKRKDLRLDAELSDAIPAPWAADLDQQHIAGSMLDETVFLHRRSRTLISADLVENFATSPHLPTRLYLKVNGVLGKVGWSRMLRLVYRDRPLARASLATILAWDFDRVVLAHGDVIEAGGLPLVRDGLRWLGVAGA
jgi:hypothetical protein